MGLVGWIVFGTACGLFSRSGSGWACHSTLPLKLNLRFLLLHWFLALASPDWCLHALLAPLVRSSPAFHDPSGPILFDLIFQLLPLHVASVCLVDLLPNVVFFDPSLISSTDLEIPAFTVVPKLNSTSNSTFKLHMDSTFASPSSSACQGVAGQAYLKNATTYLGRDVWWRY